MLLNVLNKDKKEGYVERLNVGPRVYMGEAIVKNINGECGLLAINSAENDISILIPPVVTIHDYIEVPKYLRTIKKYGEKTMNVKDRIELLERELKLNELQHFEIAGELFLSILFTGG